MKHTPREAREVAHIFSPVFVFPHSRAIVKDRRTFRHRRLNRERGTDRPDYKGLGLTPSTQRHVAVVKLDEEALTSASVRLASQYGRYGYRRVTGLLREAGWRVNKKRVERIWRRGGLKVPVRVPKRGRV